MYLLRGRARLFMYLFVFVALLGLHEQTRLEILTRNAYNWHCVLNHSNISLAGFSSGCFINLGTFIEHCPYFDVCNNSNPSYGEGRMKADFEHDLKKFTLRFTTFKQNCGWHLYKMVLNYDGIHSIVVDYKFQSLEEKAAKQNSSTYLAVYIIFKHVPKIFRDTTRNNNNKQSRELDDYSWKTHYINRFVDDVIRQKVGRSSVLKLLFPIEKDSKGETGFWELISRLKYRAKVNVYYFSVQVINGSEQEKKSNELVENVPFYFFTFF